MDLKGQTSEDTADLCYLPVEVLRDIFQYDAETGILVWRHRDRRQFKEDSTWKAWNKRNEGRPVGSKNSSGYLQVQITYQGQIYRRLVHIVIWAMNMGDWPNHSIDHINHQCDDNRWENLRPATHAENMRNRSRNRNNKTGVSGVYYDRRTRKYRAQIPDVDGIRDLGSYQTLEEARLKRDAAEIALGYHENHGIDVSSGEKPRFTNRITIEVPPEDGTNKGSTPAE